MKKQKEIIVYAVSIIMKAALLAAAWAGKSIAGIQFLNGRSPFRLEFQGRIMRKWLSRIQILQRSDYRL